MSTRNTKQDSDTAAKKDRDIDFYPRERVLRELGDLPVEKRKIFLRRLALIAADEPLPAGQVRYMTGLGNQVYEIRINGKPAFRCLYTTSLTGKIVVLHATEKTTDGSDSKIANVVKERLKALEYEERKR
ncbi:MAG: type II toxin-antitoxin system RelE/ParE family toxin [Pseudomonas farsensis]|uniref:type II toxin-antitoxin system RelE/ParE family toxin n=1 Tax=Pseudomonas farsensis TaxID=2745492 RepID=UPI003C7DCF6A